MDKFENRYYLLSNLEYRLRIKDLLAGLNELLEIHIVVWHHIEPIEFLAHFFAQICEDYNPKVKYSRDEV